MKNSKKSTIFIVCIAVFVIYVLPFLGIFLISYIDEKDKSFEIKKDTIEISEGDLIINNQESFYDAEKETYYIIGYLKNNTDNEYDYIDVQYRLYDSDKNILGEASAYLDALEGGETWKYKATYSDIDAASVDSIEFLRIDYY